VVVLRAFSQESIVRKEVSEENVVVLGAFSQRALSEKKFQKKR